MSMPLSAAILPRYLMRRAAQQHGQQMQRTRQQTSDSAQSAATTMPTMMAILIQCFSFGVSELETAVWTCDSMLAGDCDATGDRVRRPVHTPACHNAESRQNAHWAATTTLMLRARQQALRRQSVE